MWFGFGYHPKKIPLRVGADQDAGDRCAVGLGAEHAGAGPVRARRDRAGILEGAQQNDLTGLLYLAAPFAWTLGLYFVPESGSSDYNGMAFEDYFGDAVQTIYDNTTGGGVGDTDIAFSSAAAIMTWTLMNVNNPDPLLMLEDPLTNTSQLVNVGSSTDASASVASECDSPVNDVEDSDTSNRADSGCSAAAGGRGEAGHPAENPRCAPPDHLHGAVGATHRGPTARSGH